MSSLPPSSTVTAGDRLGLGIFLALAIHGIVIFGLGFDFEPAHSPAQPPMMDVVLVQSQSREAPVDARHIAQVDQQASGREAEEERPSSPVTAPLLRPTDGLAPEAVRAGAPESTPREAVEVITAKQSQQPSAPDAPTEVPAPSRELTTDELVERSLQMARLSSEISEQNRRHGHRPRTHYVDALSAKSAVEASYLDAWVRKVERVGNLNYPDEARRQRLSGSLVLSVLVNREGEVVSIEVGNSSGERVLDDAARRIVQLAAPFAPFPADMRRSYDQIMITRTWVFQGNQTLRTR
ncbi:energy transducer TonB [Ectothiorhodospira marina]|uniref:Protein TonB n=1 Tax=Ectothiorhodospira marina TaxID=1396821 RepID=A0A1H7QNQ3_9GAMM|nr:energy transducer TonB [Ectothiorhodospira marina]SEL49539.1 protein TonB [Ectothiorhodospira marina]